MEDEIKNFIKVWILALASLTYCYLIPSKIPKGKFRFLSLLPIIIFFIILPLNLTTISLGGITAFFLPWLANFNLLLFSFGKGPLSSDDPYSISFSRFIFTACLPIKIKQNPSLKSNPKTKQTTKSSPLNFAIKGLELALAIVAAMAATLLNLELEPQFHDPYLSTSLQDFWGRRWNLMVPNILRPTVYDPILYVSTVIVGRKWAALPAALATFLVSGLMHELIFFYYGRVRPTWEVTCFFVLQGFCVALEILVKKVVKGRWRLHPVVSAPLTVGFVVVSGAGLFFPQLVRCDAFVRSSVEVAAFVGFFKELGWTIFGMSNWVSQWCTSNF
ncbi:hypothetical protein BVC80_9087g50 [Macleaya cordata]|uniref:Wax synthase domain-containing protein n=1 Tax=Macleaya cordata TaxID=56857 RepID=A0A200PQQ3_MACCD|nr:hypothetical protein BVC80_9087g50 [Macleaya cordata]